MTPGFRRAVEKTLKIEGGFVDHPLDRGGPTNLGVTLAVLDSWYREKKGRPGTVEDLKALTVEDAHALYFEMYWNTARFPVWKVGDWWEPLGWKCFDNAVLHSPLRAARWLQQSLNILNRNEKDWPDLKVDARIGPQTLACLKEVDKQARGRERLLIALTAYQGKFFIEIAEGRPDQEEFIGGWFLHRLNFKV